MKALLLLLMGFISCVSVTDDAPLKDYSSKHIEALAYCKNKGFNQGYYFLVDLSVHSGRNRFYVYDFNQKKITDSGLVTHGSCDVADDNDTKYEKAKFSNADGSHCSSLGKYKIGKRDYSSWGINVNIGSMGLKRLTAMLRAG